MNIETTLTQSARVETVKGSKYIERMCKHFQHKVEAGWDQTSGWVTFAEGSCDLVLQDSALTFVCKANSQAELQDIVDTIDRHFDRFAKAEALTLTWE